MKKLIFRNLNVETAKFFFLSAVSMTVIVWIIQAVNLLDFISEDGHSFKIYFLYTVLNFPKIFSKILPFMFFISLFYTLIKFEENNELIIFWLNGVHKLTFIKNIILYSLIFFLFQIFLTTYAVPKTQDMARSFIRISTMDYLPNIIKEKKFIDAVSNMTIYVEKKEKDGLLLNIFLKENLKKKNETQTIYAKKGRLISREGKHWLIMFNGKIINQKEKESTVISFDETQINLSKYATKTTTFPKLKELKTTVLLSCAKAIFLKKEIFFKNDYLICQKEKGIELNSEILRRLYLPLYLPVIALIVCFLILTTKDNINYNSIKLKVFITSALLIIVSEISLDFSKNLPKDNLGFLSFPLILFILALLIFKKNLTHKIK